MKRVLYWLKTLIFLLSFAFASNPASAGPSASEVVERFQAALVQVMKEAEALSVQQRFDRLSPIVDKSFHIPLMIQIATGSYWKEATSPERAQLVKAFRRMSVAVLATLFDGYSGEMFKQVGEKPGPQKTLLVMTKLVKSDKSMVDIVYVSRRFKESWQIIDVVIDNGISELKVRRSEYNLVLKNKGIPGLISLLTKKADELVSQ